MFFTIFVERDELSALILNIFNHVRQQLQFLGMSFNASCFCRAFVMLPYASHYTPHQPSIQLPQQPVLAQPHISTPSPTVYTYSHGPTTQHHQQSYQTMKSIEYTLPSTVTPLQTSVDYKHSAPVTIVPKKTLPSISTTSFQQYYSPGLEYHYTEAMPVTKLAPHPSYNFQHAPGQNYHHTSYVSQAPSYNYYHTGPGALATSSAVYNKHQSSGLLESYVPSVLTYARQQQHLQPPQFKTYYPTQYHQSHQYSPAAIPQQLFSPAHSSHYAAYPSSQVYNTIQYSVPLPPYDHSKRSTSKATATLSVKV